jgi:hypothetical protein
MPMRVEVLPDSKIEIMISRADRKPSFLTYTDIERAISVVRFLIKKDIEKAERERFVPKIIKEARAEYNKLLDERNSQNG